MNTVIDWYCPYCGRKVRNGDVYRWLKYGPGEKCFDPDCEGKSQ